MNEALTLTRFAKDVCANYNSHYKTCITDGPCKVLGGERCGYFEKCVLGPADYAYRLPNYDYQKLFAQYAEQTGAESKVVKQRLCGCGDPLGQRRRFCDSCAKARARASNRRRQRSHRLSTVST